MPETGQEEKPCLPCPALILCGGRSRRMGRDKAFLPLGSKTMLQRVESVFTALASETMLVIGYDATEPEACGFSAIVRDENPDFGPLEGMRVGITKLASHDLVLVGTCDAPMVKPEVYRLFYESLMERDDCQAVIPFIKDQHYPLTAIYRTSVLAQITQMVGARELRVKDLLTKVKILELTESDVRQADPNLDTIRNINTRDEYERMLQDFDAAR